MLPLKGNFTAYWLESNHGTAQIKPLLGKHQSIFHTALHFKIANFIVSEKIGTKWIQTCLTLLELTQLITEWGLNHSGATYIFKPKVIPV